MKASKYNIFFKHDGLHVGFNSYTQEFLLLDPLLLELYLNGKMRRDFSELKTIHSDFYSHLVNEGFLVEDDIDEFERVKALSRKIDNDDRRFHLIINPTMNCNFKCWYCYETHIKDSKMDSNTINATVSFAKHVIKTQEHLEHFSLAFFGGEPLLYFDKVIKPILAELHTACTESGIKFTCGMTTNGLLINQQMLEFCALYGLDNFQITLDGNKEQHDKVRFISEGKGSYEKIVSNIRLVVKNRLYANVRINCSPSTVGSLNEVIQEFSDLTSDESEYISFDIHKVWQVDDDIEQELDESRDQFRLNNLFTTSGAHDTVVNSCYADKRYQATINYNGEVFKCTARDFKSGTNEGVLNNDGTITWNDKHEKRLNIKFNNRPCRECSIMPICGGGCTQQALEHEGADYCIYNFNEDEKMQQVTKRFLALVN